MIRPTLLLIFSGICYLLLLFSLWNEQLRYGEEHRQMISKQSIRCIRQPGIRGKILSSDMKIIADITQQKDMLFHISEMRKPGKLSNTISHIISVAEQISKATGRKITLNAEEIQKHINHKPALPLKVIRDLSDKEIAAYFDIYPRIPGVEISVSNVRNYPMGDFAAHIIGYLGKEDPSKDVNRKDFFYYQPDYEGKSGIERLCDQDMSEIFGVPAGGLKGVEGYSLVRVDNRGFVNETLETFVPPSIGKNVVLTLNSKAQEIAEFILLEKKGAFVLFDISNGEIVAMASSPSFNPGIFIPSISSNEYSALLKSPDKPMFNRAIFAEYTPGSIFKPLITLALLDAGKSPNEIIHCPGYTLIGNRPIHCWLRTGHGDISMIKALEQSCNTYFIEQGGSVGFDKIKATLEKAGIGEKTGFELGESKGLCPSREFKKKRMKEDWNIFDTALLSIGQGIILITPLQAATYMAAIANNGTAYKPHVIKAVYDHDGNLIAEKKNDQLCINMNLPQEYFDIVRRGMFDVVNSPTGTGRKARSDKITIYAKTGTAEIIKNTNEKRKNTWMAGFAENNNKKYSFALTIEDGISGGTTCAPLIKKFFDEFLD